MPDLVIPHTFVDGPGNTASGEEVSENFGAIRTLLNGNLDEDNFDSGAALPDEILESPNNAIWKTIETFSGQWSNLSSSGINAFRAGDTMDVVATGANPVKVVHLDPADYAVPGLTTRFRLRGCVITNATDPVTVFTPTLYTVASFGGGSGVHGVTLGPAVTGATMNLDPAAAGGDTDVSAAFALTTEGVWVLAANFNVAPVANSKGILQVRLEVRNT